VSRPGRRLRPGATGGYSLARGDPGAYSQPDRSPGVFGRGRDTGRRRRAALRIGGADRHGIGSSPPGRRRVRMRRSRRRSGWCRPRSWERRLRSSRSPCGTRSSFARAQLGEARFRPLVEYAPLGVVDLNAAIRGPEPILRATLPERILLELEPVMLNLALHARAAMSGRGTLRFETRRVQTGRFVHLTVSDTGQEMDEATRALSSRYSPPWRWAPEPRSGSRLATEACGRQAVRSRSRASAGAAELPHRAEPLGKPFAREPLQRVSTGILGAV